jgi:hypothetical protein
MLCPRCGVQNPTPFGYCSGCGKALSTVDGAPGTGGPIAGAAPGMAPEPVVAKNMSLVAVLAIVAVTVGVVTIEFMLATGEKNPDVALGFHIGRLIPTLLVPFLIAYVIAGRKRARKPNLFAGIFCGIALLFTTNTAISSGGLDLGESADQRVGRLMREAAGTQPVHQSIWPARRRFDDALREQFRALVRQNKEYSETIRKMDVSQIKNLNTPESFANPEAASGALRQLHDLCDDDAAQEVKVKEIIGNLRQALEKSASSPSERETLVNGFDKGFEPQSARRQAVVAAEKVWMDSVDDEYAYAAHNPGKLVVVNGHLIINDAEVRETFNTKLRFQQSQRKAFLAAQKEFDAFQAQSLQKLGVSPHDVGAQ